MISRYALYNISELSTRFGLTKGVPKGIKPNYNYSPTKEAPIIIRDEAAAIIKPMKWGLVAQGAKDTNSVFRYKTFNIPSEKILSRHSWERAVRESRCLVPANGYYELNGSGKKRASYVQPSDKELFAFAGVYGSWQDPEGTIHGTFSVITIEVPGTTKRIPVIIRREDESRWLNPAITDASSLYDMLRLYPDELLQSHEVSPAVHSPKPNTPSLIDPS